MGEGNVKMVVVPQSSQPQEAGPGPVPVFSLAGLANVPEFIYKFYSWPGQPLTIGQTEIG